MSLIIRSRYQCHPRNSSRKVWEIDLKTILEDKRGRMSLLMHVLNDVYLDTVLHILRVGVLILLLYYSRRSFLPKFSVNPSAVSIKAFRPVSEVEVSALWFNPIDHK